MVPAQVAIVKASLVPMASGVPEHCKIEGTIEHGSKIGFAAALPSDWNGKFLFYGIGGFAGVLNPLELPPSSAGLVKGYATATTDTGHQSPTVEDATWALNNPAAILNHYEASVDRSATTVKALIASYYGRAARRSYFEGCSAGGRQGIVEAQRFPGTFDGIIAAAPTWNYSALLASFIMNGQRILQSPANWIAPETFEAIDREVLRQCDTLDGVVDGIIMDPRQCRPDLSKLRCVKGAQRSCLSSAQVATLDWLLHPAFARRTGFFGYHLTGSERSSGLFGWPHWIFGTKPVMADAGGRANFGSRVLTGADRGLGPLQFLLGEQFFRFMVMKDPKFDAREFRFERDMPVLTRKLGAFLDADQTNLGPFVRGGGKLLIWHGWSDGAVPAEMAIDLFERVRRDTAVVPGQLPLEQSLRLFMVPGVQHCSSGSGLTDFDALTALDSWVEQGRPPERIGASQLVDGRPVRSRPLCPFPQTAHYSGSGDPDNADNFTCR
jgi:feruloyl esterase